MKLALILTLCWSASILWIALCMAAAKGDRIIREHFKRDGLTKSSSPEVVVANSLSNFKRTRRVNSRRHNLGKWLRFHGAIR